MSYLINSVSFNGIFKGAYSHEKIKRPVAICVDKFDSNVFIGENNPCNVLVFDSDMNFKRGFDICVRVATMTSLASDLNDLYVLDCKANRIAVFNSRTGQYNRCVKITAPFEIEILSETIFVLSSCLELNSICLLNKKSLELIREIRHDFCFFRGLCVKDSVNGNYVLITTSFDKNDKTLSKRGDLILLDENGNTLVRKELPFIQNGFNYLNFMDKNQLIACYDKKIKIINFQN